MAEEFTLEFRTQREWEWLAILDLFLAGGGAGLFLLGVFLEINLATVVGVVATALGALALLIDLGRPERFWRSVCNPVTSWISRGVILVSAFLLFGAIYAAPTISWLSWLPWTAEGGLGSVARVIAAVAAVGVMAYTGFLLSYSPAIPSWHNTMLPILFIVFSLVTATGALYALLPLIDETLVELRVWEGLGLGLVVGALVMVAAYLLTLASSTLAAREAARTLLRGSLATAFVGGVIVLGLLLPLSLIITVFMLDMAQASATTYLVVSGLFLILGGLSLRYSLLRAGVYQPIV